MSIEKEFVDVIKSAGKKETKPYDTQATVTRVEGQTVWVHIPGGVDETPIKRTVNAKEGDIVQVRVSGGSAWLMGNASSPPTDDTKALVGHDMANAAKDLAEISELEAKKAQKAAVLSKLQGMLGRRLVRLRPLQVKQKTLPGKRIRQLQERLHSFLLWRMW